MFISCSQIHDDACDSTCSAICCASNANPPRPIDADQAARIDASVFSEKLPFVAQNGRTLYLVTEESAGWVLAELEFDSSTCEFAVLHRSEYRWPREALGRLLSRLNIGSPDGIREASRMSDAFTDWHAAQFVA